MDELLSLSSRGFCRLRRRRLLFCLRNAPIIVGAKIVHSYLRNVVTIGFEFAQFKSFCSTTVCVRKQVIFLPQLEYAEKSDADHVAPNNRVG